MQMMLAAATPNCGASRLIRRGDLKPVYLRTGPLIPQDLEAANQSI